MSVSRSTDRAVVRAESAAVHFAELLTEMPAVRYVGLAGSDRKPCLAVIIEAEPFDRAARYPVYEAYGSMLDAFDGVALDLRLSNAREYEVGAWDDLVPATARDLLRR